MFDWQRPASRVRLREVDGYPSKVWKVQGWRAESIAATLDQCAQLLGDLHLSQDAVVRVVDGAKYWRAQAAKNRDRARENSRVQSAKVRERQRVDHAAYVQRLAAEIPWAVPIGFKRWRMDWWRTWRTDPARCIFETRRTAEGAKAQHARTSEWLWGDSGQRAGGVGLAPR